MAARFAPSHATLVAPSRPSDATHCAVHLLHSLAPLGIDLSFDDHAFELRPMVSDEILVHPGSGSPAKNWPVERFAEVIGALPVPIGLILGEADETADAMLDKAYPRLCRRPLGVLAERLAGCRAYLGNDSGISHLAGLSGARTVVMFGPTDPRVWRPLGPRVSVLGFDASAATVVEELLGRGG
jgi:ADP-heptose:LPS heptosyltransferase